MSTFKEYDRPENSISSKGWGLTVAIPNQDTIHNYANEKGKEETCVELKGRNLEDILAK